ncbi:MAG: S-methyl-5'-thioadenosine phosphorylase [Candidatus Methylarchaceae archaeon HK01M]|nr:S-methyl-5'-thioadenosine phosphorylase [Candidatus Methylarchaceae archaeon HK01M]
MKKLERRRVDIAVIGGTGFYDPRLMEDSKEMKVYTPYGRPSDFITIGHFKGKKIAFIQRHGEGHQIPPHGINYRANIWSLKQLEATRIIAPAAVGSLREELRPGDIVIPDQFIDRTSGRASSFYDGGQICHISIANPFCQELSEIAFNTGKELNLPVHKGGTCVVIQGPRFSTKAESQLYRSWGADIINMTMVPECVLAREAEICYLPIATISDYDVWKDGLVSVDEIVKTLKENVEKTRKLLEVMIPKIPRERSCDCKDALRNAIL